MHTDVRIKLLGLSDLSIDVFECKNCLLMLFFFSDLLIIVSPCIIRSGTHAYFLVLNVN